MPEEGRHGATSIPGMATPPVVSVVTPVFNCMPYLRDTLSSVFHQSMRRPDVEMIAVN